MVGDAAPVVNALKKLSLLPGGHSLYWIRLVVLLGALMGMISSILVYQIGQSRVWFSMSRDGLLPKVFSNVHPLFRTPAFSTWVAGVLVAIPSGLFDIGTLADLSNIGTLFAFVLVSIGVIVLRFREPERRRGFVVPGGPVIPALSVIFCFLLMAGLPIITWYRFVIWLVIGLFIYFSYGFFRSEFTKPGVPLFIPFWAVLLLTLVTLGLFPLMMLLMQASFVRSLRGSKSPQILGALVTIFILASVIVRLYSPTIAAILELTATVAVIAALLQISAALDDYYTNVEPIGLHLSSFLTILFGVFYIQYHLSRIAEWKRTGTLRT
jgi:hypothetical protein